MRHYSAFSSRVRGVALLPELAQTVREVRHVPHGEGGPRVAGARVRAVAVDPHCGGQARVDAALDVRVEAVADVHCLRGQRINAENCDVCSLASATDLNTAKQATKARSTEPV